MEKQNQFLSFTVLIIFCTVLVVISNEYSRRSIIDHVSNSQRPIDQLSSSSLTPSNLGTFLHLETNHRIRSEESPVLNPVQQPIATYSIERGSIESIEADATRSSDIRYADFLASLDGYSAEHIESLRSIFAESETEIKTISLSVDFSSPNISNEISEKLAAIEQKKKERLTSLLSSKDIKQLDSYVGSLYFRGKLPDIRGQLVAKSLPFGEKSSMAVANAYQRAIEKHRVTLAKAGEGNNASNVEESSFDSIFLSEAAHVLDGATFDAFSNIYLDYQYK